MRRQDLRLLALARTGDVQARCEVGRRYLMGADGYPRHVASGIEHLSHPSVAHLPQASRILAECMPLEELIDARLFDRLEHAADARVPAAQAKLGAWLLARNAAAPPGMALLGAAAGQGYLPAAAAVRAWQASGEIASTGQRLAIALGELGQRRLLEPRRVAIAAVAAALRDGDLDCAGTALRLAVESSDDVHAEVAAMISSAVQAAEAAGSALADIDVASVELALERQATSGDAYAAHALGRALCGMDLGALSPRVASTAPNMRKGVALLLRAADAGCDNAWLQLYRVHSDHRLSVANPQLARYFLEKAAARDVPEAQRRLGALILRSAATLGETEQAIAWLHRAAGDGDGHAMSLLRSLVLRLPGSTEEAEEGIVAVAQSDPWLSARMRVAREFGLTKLEALCFDPAAGVRSWGLVVGQNPFITHSRLGAPRAVPALSAQALQHLSAVADLFASGSPRRYEGDLRRRSLNQRRAFARLALDESVFFASATSPARDALRLGPKWAFKERLPLQRALAH